MPQDEASALWSMNYEKLTPVLVKAIQEQQTIIDTLRQEQDATQALLKELVQKIENLSARL